MKNKDLKERFAKAVLFDCDGVLVNTEESMFAAGYRYVREIGLELSRADYAALTIGGTGPQLYIPQLAKIYADAHGTPAPLGFGQELCARIYEAADRDLAPVDGVADLIAELRLRGVPCAVGTNAGTAWTRHKLGRLGLHGHFNQHIYSHGAGVAPKPAPDIYHHAARALGQEAENCFVVEDSIAGVKAGVAAGATVIGFAGGAHRDGSYAAALRAAGAHFTARTMAQVGRILTAGLHGFAP